MVRLKGLEPSRPKTPDPKSGASTNSATSALCDIRSGWGKCCTRLRKCSAKVTFFIRLYKFYLLKLLQNEINVLLLLLL